jgi:3-hydroxyacyl-CoA dehydrogenase
MGSGIAAQAANAGCEVVLLDIREGAAQAAVERMKKANPATDPFNAGFMDAGNARLITCGTTDNDIEKIGDADLVIEAVFERLDVKQNTFKMIDKYARPDALITSNTSTLTIDSLVEGMPESFKKRFMNAHFFNPPRFMRLLELIAGPETAPETFDAVRDYGDRHLGKKVVRCKDMPGFIANRIGVFIIECARATGLEQGMKVEDIDAILGAPFGFPKLGVFKLADAVGVDIVQHVGKNLHAGLPADDMFNQIYDPSMIDKMVADGYTGKKGKGGFYRSDRKAGTSEAIDLRTGEYRPAGKSGFARVNIEKKFGSMSNFFESKAPEAKFAWPVLRDTLTYVLTHAKEIAYDVQSIDEAMRAGYNWKYGPFELLDKMGVAWFTASLRSDGIAVPRLLEKAAGRQFYHVENNVRQVMNFNGLYEAVKAEDGVIRLDDFKRGKKPLVSHNSAKLWDIGDGVVCLEFTSKQNSLDPSILHVLNESIKLVNNSGGKYKAMVVYNDGENFSVGANLKIVDLFNKMAAAPAKFGAAGRSLSRYLNGKVEAFVENQVFQGQAVYKALREAPFPVIGAPKGQALGGGCELLLH